MKTIAATVVFLSLTASAFAAEPSWLLASEPQVVQTSNLLGMTPVGGFAPGDQCHRISDLTSRQLGHAPIKLHFRSITCPPRVVPKRKV